MNLQRDQIVGQRYQLVELLGEGGMGAVWSAIHVVTRKPVAIKFLKSTGNAPLTEQLAQRFIREARAASAVHHPNVVEIHDILTLDDGAPMMVMDLLRGRTLAALLELRTSLTTEETATIMLPIVSAVGAAHAIGIVHRDLKPENLFLAELGDGRVEPKVLDFGIAKLSASEGDAKTTSNLTATGSMLGTPYYMSPEQMFGEKDIDGRADIWSLGVIMYECLTGRRPFDGENFGQLLKAISSRTMTPVEQIVPHAPRDIAHLVDRMIRVERGERPASLQEVHALLATKTTSRDSARISLASPQVTQPSPQRTAYITPTPGMPPQIPTMSPPQPFVTGPQPMHAQAPGGPRPGSAYGPPPAFPTTLSGASTSQNGLAPVVPMNRGMPLGAVIGIVGALFVVGGGGIAFLVHRSHAEQQGVGLQPTADAQPTPSAKETAAPATTTPPPTATEPPSAAPTVTAIPTESAVATAKPPAPAPAPVPAPAATPTSTHHTSPTPSTAATTVPGGVATTVPF